MSIEKSKVSHWNSVIKRKIMAMAKNIDLKLLMGLLFVVCGFLAFFVFASEVVEGETRNADEWLLLILRTPGDLSRPIGPSWLLDTMRDFTALGGGTILSLITAIAVASLAIVRRYKESVLVFGAIVLGEVANYILKHVYARPRPTIVPHLVAINSESFPSGHSMMSALVYMTIGALLAAAVKDRRFKVFIVCVAAMISLVIGVSRIYLGVHFPSDVVGGWAFGLVWAIGGGIVARSKRFTL